MRPPKLMLSLCAALACGAGLAACGQEEEEGEPLREGEHVEVGELTYNVAITRFLNPDDPEDSEYLVGAPELQSGHDWLGVFVKVENHSDTEAAELAGEFTITDTREEEYEPVEIENPYAMSFDVTVPAGGELPEPDTTAATGPIKGEMLLYEIPAASTENRPFILEISDGEHASEVQLDL